MEKEQQSTTDTWINRSQQQPPRQRDPDNQPTAFDNMTFNNKQLPLTKTVQPTNKTNTRQQIRETKKSGKGN
jgi:hypothetical protein